jgi:hypothetical protein
MGFAAVSRMADSFDSAVDWGRIRKQKMYGCWAMRKTTGEEKGGSYGQYRG